MTSLSPNKYNEKELGRWTLNWEWERIWDLGQLATLLFFSFVFWLFFCFCVSSTTDVLHFPPINPSTLAWFLDGHYSISNKDNKPIGAVRE